MICRLERKTAPPVVFRMTAVVPIHRLEYQMSKRKPATASKRARSPKSAAKAQRAIQAIVRSPKLRLRGQARLNRPPIVITTQTQWLL